ncbi:hypothetical protein PV326_005972 [Microctonus aethiopoides]|uniref:Mitochondrial carrier homolog 2 n=1 Tax=Microctonus aethiopoides TaxID=144406 RepID=A0AA39FXX3_9HYME|nr:hypothetical protein PV326_005972 [Microctonus aethiopoides]KAK0177862.1 hypothetical protein PV328_001870 [Microctonus aethiopoides]
MFQPRDTKEERLWSNIAIRMLVNTISHPLEYAKVLIQIGYEPISPKNTRTLFGKPALALPNIFQYVRYIKSVDGFTGCYRGLVPKLCAYTVSTVTNEKISESFLFTEIFPDMRRNKDEDVDDLPDEQRIAVYKREFIKDVICKIVSIIVSHPLDVITLRTMAQFIGGETKYNGVIHSLVEVYRENGFMGYYSGLAPRLIANIATLALVSSSTYAINKYIVHDRESRGYTSAVMTFLATTVTYPFLVVYHCMAVNNCGLAAGSLPQMPIYSSWIDCWQHLSLNNQLKRGSSLLWRYYTGPQVVINGRVVKLDKTNFYSHN